MIAVVIDTNAVHNDPWLARTGQSLLSLAAGGECVIAYPEIVSRELRRQQDDLVGDMRRKVKEARRKITASRVIEEHFEDGFTMIEREVAEKFNSLWAKPGVVLLPLPTVSVDALLGRDLDRRRPFTQTKVGGACVSTGMRDVLIWETVLEALAPGSAFDRIVFVTHDHGFVDKGGRGLQTDLMDDLAARDIDSVRITVAANIPDATTKARALTEATAAASRRAAIAVAATDAVMSLESESISMQMVYGGDYDYPEFVKFEVPSLEDATISAIEQLTEFEVPAEGDMITVTATVRVHIDGYIFKSDWFMQDGGARPEIFEYGNDHFFAAEDWIDVLAVVELDASGDVPVVLNLELRDLPARS